MTMTIRDLDPAHAGGMTHLASIGDASYYELAIVVKSAAGRTAIAGLAQDWPLIRRDAELGRLRALLADKDAEIAALKDALRQTPEAPRATAPTPEPAPVEAPAQLACDRCDKAFPNTKALTMHRRRAHEGMRARPAGERPTSGRAHAGGAPTGHS